MTLRLSIVNLGRPTLDNGGPAELHLDRCGALIGRAPSCDWSLPDPRNHISSRHCEIRYQDGSYALTDVSMNGTFVNDRPDRLVQPCVLHDGDVVTIGHYRIRVIVEHQAAAPIASGLAPSPIREPAGWPAPSAPGAWGSVPNPVPAAVAPDTPPTDGHGWGKASPALGSSYDERWGSPPRPVAENWRTPGAVSKSGGWAEIPAPGISDGWSDAPASPTASGNDGWGPATGPVPASSAWDRAIPDRQPASGWSSPAPDRPPAAAPDDIWGRLAEGNVVDWARSGFGQPIEAPADPLGLSPPATNILGAAPANPFERSTPWSDSARSPGAAPVSDMHFAMPGSRRDGPSASAAPDTSRQTGTRQEPEAVSPAAQTPMVTPPIDNLIEVFLRAAGVESLVAQRNPALLDRAGRLFHRLIAGLVVMVEARARAKSQMGAQSTIFEVDGNNPIKFSRTPEDAITALLNPPTRGFLDAGQAIEEAFFDLQSHQIATLRAMQGALRTTLDRFSPGSIRRRAETRGLLARILPSSRDAALWQAYEKEFSGVAQDSDEAFMDMFAKEFRRAYEEQVQERKTAT